MTDWRFNFDRPSPVALPLESVKRVCTYLLHLSGLPQVIEFLQLVQKGRCHAISLCSTEHKTLALISVWNARSCPLLAYVRGKHDFSGERKGSQPLQLKFALLWSFSNSGVSADTNRNSSRCSVLLKCGGWLQNPPSSYSALAGRGRRQQHWGMCRYSVVQLSGLQVRRG